LAALGHRDDANFAKHTEMLGYRRLGYTQHIDDVAHRARLTVEEYVNDFSTAGFGDGIEYVGGGGSAGHQQQYILTWEYVKRFLRFGNIGLKMPKRKQSFVIRRVLIGILLVLMATLQTRFTAVTVEVISEAGAFPAIPQLDTIKLTLNNPGKASLDAGMRKGDLLMAVDGEAIDSRAEEARIFFRHKPGDTVKLTLLRGGRTRLSVNYTVVKVLELSRWGLLILIILNIVTPWSCILLGFLAAFRRPDEAVTWPLLFLLICVSQAFRGYVDPPYAWNIALSWPALFFDVFAIPGMAAAWLWVAIQFPDPRSPNRVWPWARWALGVPFLVPYALGGIWFATVVHDPKALAWLAPINEIPDWLLETWGATAIVLGCVNLAYKLKRETNPSMRRRLRWAVPGLVGGILPAPAAIVINGGSLAGLPLPILLTCLFSPFLIPLTLAYALLVDRMFDVGVVVRQGLLASSTVSVMRTALLAALIYLAVFFVTDKGVSGLMRLAEVAACVTAMAVTLRGAEWLRHWVDRRFFQEAVNSERLLMELAGEVRGIRDSETILRTVTERIANAMHVLRVVALLPNAAGYKPAYALGDADSAGLAFGDATVTEMKRSRRPTRGTEDLLVPISTGGELLGILRLGPKRSEEPYSGRDLSLLESVANQTALALENTRLAAAVAEEAAQRERITSELEIARTVQERLFPKSAPNVRGLDLAGRCQPAQTVGGDYFDFFGAPCLTADAAPTTGFAIGDIAGKGVPAALLMAALQASLRGITLAGVTDLADLMEKLNVLMYDASPANRFATFFCCLYEANSGRLRYSSAGHNPALLWRANADEAVWLNTRGTALGLRRKAAYEQAEVILNAGDRLVLYTDGVTEARNSAGEEFGEERFAEAARRAGECSASGMVAVVMEEISRFVGSATQHDDITMIVAVRR